MKKSILLFAVGLGILTSCDPIKEDGDFTVTEIAAADLLTGAEFAQYADAECTTPAEDGNYIKFNIPSVPSVTAYTLQADGSEFVLSRGKSGGVMALMPRRGSDPNQTVYFRYTNQVGEDVVATKNFFVFVSGELDPAVKILASNDYGEKTWKWDPTITGAVWGNMGYCGGAGSAVGQHGEGQWWGVTSTDDFNGQLDHTEDKTNHGDGDLNAYMVFSEDGLLKAYDANGQLIRSDAFTVENYNPAGEWKVGDLLTTAILWPYEINSGGNIPGRYEICYLTPDKMTLVYPDGGDFGGLGNWAEASFWHFCSDSDFNGMAAGYDDGKSWTWDPEITGAVWGNMGYCGGAGSAVGLNGEGQWWGITSTEEFDGQLDHTEDGVNHGDGDMDAFMTLGADGTIKRCAADGTVINSGTYEFVPVAGNDWKVAELNTTAGTILWPYEINSGGNMPTTFEVVYMTGSKMTLVYPDGGDFGGLGNWGEASFWHFKAKE